MAASISTDFPLPEMRRKTGRERLAVMTRAKEAAVKVRDEDIESEVKKAFEKADFRDIGIEVKNGVVRLTGTVSTGTRRLDAAVLARSIQGVRAVKDELRLETAKR